MRASARRQAKPGLATAAALAGIQAALFWEHLWPWLPAYLDAVTDLGAPALTGWAELTRRAMAAEYSAQPEQAQLPLALRAAPAAACRTARRSASPLP